MSLSTWEQRALNSIKDDVASCDPALAARLSIFTRLASGQEMPAREKIYVGSRRAVRRSRPEPRHTRRAYQRLVLQQAVMLLWLVTAVALIAIALACHRGGSQGKCTGSRPTICTGMTSAPNSGPGHSLNTARVRGGAGAGARPTGRRAGVTLTGAWNTDSASACVKPGVRQRARRPMTPEQQKAAAVPRPQRTPPRRPGNPAAAICCPAIPH